MLRIAAEDHFAGSTAMFDDQLTCCVREPRQECFFLCLKMIEAKKKKTVIALWSNISFFV